VRFSDWPVCLIFGFSRGFQEISRHHFSLSVDHQCAAKRTVGLQGGRGDGAWGGLEAPTGGWTSWAVLRCVWVGAHEERFRVRFYFLRAITLPFCVLTLPSVEPVPPAVKATAPGSRASSRYLCSKIEAFLCTGVVGAAEGQLSVVGSLREAEGGGGEGGKTSLCFWKIDVDLSMATCFCCVNIVARTGTWTCGEVLTWFGPNAHSMLIACTCRRAVGPQTHSVDERTWHTFAGRDVTGIVSGAQALGRFLTVARRPQGSSQVWIRFPL